MTPICCGLLKTSRSRRARRSLGAQSKHPRLPLQVGWNSPNLGFCFPYRFSSPVRGLHAEVAVARTRSSAGRAGAHKNHPRNLAWFANHAESGRVYTLSTTKVVLLDFYWNPNCASLILRPSIEFDSNAKPLMVSDVNGRLA